MNRLNGSIDGFFATPAANARSTVGENVGFSTMGTIGLDFIFLEFVLFVFVYLSSFFVNGRL